MPSWRSHRDVIPSMPAPLTFAPVPLPTARGPKSRACLAAAWILYATFSAACTPRDAKAPPLAESVTFVKAAPLVGRTAAYESSVDFRLEGEARADRGAPNRIRTESIDRERKREEILAVFERTVIKKRVTFDEIRRTETRNGLPIQGPPNPLVGRTYVVELKESVPVFTSGAGEAVSDAEARELVRRIPNFGKPDPFLEGIPDGPLSPGSPAMGMAGGFLEMFEAADESNRDGPDIGNVEVRFAGVRDEPQGRCGVFAFTMRIQVAGEPEVRLNLDGEFLVRVSDGAPIRLEARGPARMLGLEEIEGVKVSVRAEGEMSSTLRVSYR